MASYLRAEMAVLKVAEKRVPLDIEPARESVFYLNTKKLRIGHLIELTS